MIHLIIGRQGGGKTLLLVKMAYEAYNAGKPVYSNVALNFPYKRISVQDVINCKLENGIVIIDEIHLLLPARNCMSRQNRLICDGFLSMIRKKGLEVYGTTQTLRKVDIRFREEADFNYLCQKYVETKKAFAECYDEKMCKNNTCIIGVLVEECISGQTLNMSFIANDYYKFYDTKQIIPIDGA